MEDINFLAKNFKLRLKSFYKKKSYYILNTNCGIFKLYKSYNTKEELEFFHEIKEHIREKSVFYLDNFLISSMNKPYFTTSDGIYVLCEYKDFPQADFSDNEQFRRIIKNMAILHKSMCNIDFKSPKKYYTADYISDLERKSKSFDLIKKKINRQSSLSDFDIYYIKNYSFYKNKIHNTIKSLNEIDINKLIRGSAENNDVCHFFLKEENICLDNVDIYFKNFSEAKIAPHVFDLIFIIDRYIKKMPKNRLSINEILNLYQKNNDDFRPQDLKLIFPLMDFPSRYLKLCDKYYSKKRSWAPVSMIKKMEYIKNESEIYSDYINKLIL